MLLGLDGGAVPSHPADDVAAAAGAPSAAVAALDLGGVPASARERVGVIRSLIADLEQRAAAGGFAGADLIELDQIATVYLPRLLQSYAEIPAAHRSQIFRDTGRSASFLLTERLDRIVDRLNEIGREVARGHIDAFSDNVRFIDMRYGTSASPFD
jgi:hypothetical protein